MVSSDFPVHTNIWFNCDFYTARKRTHYDVDSDESDDEAHDITQKRRQDEKSDDEPKIQEAKFLGEALPGSAKITAEEKPKVTLSRNFILVAVIVIYQIVF